MSHRLHNSQRKRLGTINITYNIGLSYRLYMNYISIVDRQSLVKGFGFDN